MDTKDFKAPKPNRFAIAVAKAVVPFVNRWYLKGLTLDIDVASITCLKKIDGHPTVFAPNHAAHADPAVMFLLSKRLSQAFYYMTARETFGTGRFGTLRSFLMQRLGAYSIVRGTADRNAFRTTRQLLVNGDAPLVIFAEGEISRQNDTVMRFEKGMTQLCFWALADMRKAGSGKPLYIVPLGIKYRYTHDMWDTIDTALTRLERKILPTEARTHIERYQRLRRIGVEILSTLMKEYHAHIAAGPLDAQIQAMKEHILSHAEKIMGIHSDADVLTRIRTLKNLVDAEVYRDVEQMTAYERQVHAQQLQKFQLFYPDLERLINFIAISDGYVAEEPSPERFLEVISRLEKEVFGSSKMRGPRVAAIRAGEPKNLAECYETYSTEKKETVEKITLELETAVQHLIAAL